MLRTEMQGFRVTATSSESLAVFMEIIKIFSLLLERDSRPDSFLGLILWGRKFWVCPNRSEKIISRVMHTARAATAAAGAI